MNSGLSSRGLTPEEQSSNFAVATVLRHARLRMGLTLAHVALATDISLKALKAIEAGETDVDLMTFHTLCANLDVNAAELYRAAENYDGPFALTKQLSRSLLTQQQLGRLERQHGLICLQLVRLKRQLEVMGSGMTSSSSFNVERVRKREEIGRRIAVHQEIMALRTSQLRRARQWCEENERFYLSRIDKQRTHS